MDKQYMDYGSLIDKNTYTVPRNLTLIDYEKKGLVYHLTHDGEGKSLSFMNKAFISFTYGDKKIEDFGFIATTVNSRLDRENSPNSEDYTTEYKMLHGQYYWGSHYLARTMVITLATDGMTQKQLDNFKYWFQAGEIRELILSLHPNRAILARVLDRPEINVLPFKRTKRVFINNDWQDIEIIEYKGEAQINFVMDEPFWYAKHNVLGEIVEDLNGNNLIVDKWINSNGLIIDTLDNDAMRVILEDMIPSASMVRQDINFSEFYLQNLLELKNLYKYTLTNATIGESFDPITNLAVVGTPVVNDDLDIYYPQSGAIIGPIYGKKYILNSIINLDDYRFYENLEFSINDGKIIKSSNELLQEYNIASIINYIPIKKGSTINLNLNNDNCNVIIAEFKRKNLVYEFNKYVLLDNENNSYEANENIYIGLTFLIKKQINNEEENNYLDFITYNLKYYYNLNMLIQNDNFNYFYSGTAPSFPEINFSIPLTFDDNGYINCFSNIYVPNSNKTYDNLKLVGRTLHKIKITNPGIFNAYNQVITKIKNSLNKDYISFIQELRNEIGHPIVRSWIVNCINIYFNNYNNQNDIEEKVLIDLEVQNQLLLYMPYLFASVLEANIIPTLSDPDRITNNRLEISILSIERLTETKLGISNDNKIAISNGADLRLQVKDGESNWNYQWEYSNDNKKTWLGIIYEPTTKWLGTDTRILTMKNVDTVNDLEPSLFIRCLVSNKISYNYTQLYLLIAFDDAVTIYSENNIIKKTITQGETGQLNWTVTGQYLTGTEAYFENAGNFLPRIYYLLKDSDNWKLYNNTNSGNNCKGQLQNISKTFNNGIYSFTFTANENLNYLLRDTKFKLRVYKKTAGTSDLEDANTYVESNPITIKITRFEKVDSNEPCVTIERSYNGESLTSYNDLTSWPDLALAEIRNTVVSMKIENVHNMLPSTSYFQYSRINDETKEILWCNLTINDLGIQSINITSTSAIMTWIINVPNPNNKYLWFNNNNAIRFFGDGPNLPIIFREIVIYQQSDDISNKYVDNYSPKNATYNTLSTTKYYTNFSSDINLVVNANQEYPATPRKIITYKWQKGEIIVVDSNAEIQWTDIQTNTYDSLEKSSNEEYMRHFISDTYTFLKNNNKYSVDQTGYYRCVILLKLYYPVVSLEMTLPYKNFEIIVSSNDFNIKIIEPIISDKKFGDIQGIYYQSEQLLDINGETIEFPYAHNIKYHFTSGIDSIDMGINTYLQRKSNSKWVRINNVQKSKLNGQYLQYTFPLEYNASDFYTKYNNDTYRGYIKDIFNKAYTNLGNFNFNIITMPSREQDITNDAQNVIIENDSITRKFYWPIISYRLIFDHRDTSIGFNIYNIELTYPNQEIINLIQYDYNNTDGEHIWRVEGIIPQDILNSASNGYPGNNYSIGNQNTLGSQYNTSNENIHTKFKIFTVNNLKNYQKIKLQFSLPVYNLNYNYKIIITSNTNNSSTTNINKNGIFDIELRLGEDVTSLLCFCDICYNQEWSSNIGYAIVDRKENMFSYEQGKYYSVENGSKGRAVIYGLTGNPAPSEVIDYDATKFPVIDCSIILKKIIVVPRFLNSIIELDDGTPILRSFRKSRIVYSRPSINQKCPVSINCETGEYTIKVQYNSILWPDCALTPEELGGDIFNPKLICYLSSLRNGIMKLTNESAGDMILYNDIAFTEQNHFTQTNLIIPWTQEDPTSCYKITYDGLTPLINFVMKYKNYYL